MEDKLRGNVCRERLVYAFSKYLDYCRYFGSLADLDEAYDETYETNDFESWLLSEDAMIRSKAAEMLRVTCKLFFDLLENGEQELYSVLETISKLEKEEQQDIWGFYVANHVFEKSEIREFISEWDGEEYYSEEVLNGFLVKLRRKLLK